ncbi:MAG TPA: Ig-like domain-containing protein [Gemmatimonadales bacterium]|nr:Ig-like domain-containing protein [Gemmatimonadales bacterium]
MAAGMLAALQVASCGLADVVGPPGRTTVRFSFGGDSVLVVGTRVAPDIAVEVNGDSVPHPRLLLGSSDPTILAVTAGGDSLVALHWGTARLTIRLESALVPFPGPTDTVDLRVVVGSVALDRATDTLWSLGDSTAPFVATGYDAAGNPLPGVPFIWESSDTSVAQVNPVSHRVVARKGGSATVRAIADRVTATAMVVVRQRLARFTFAPPGLFFDALGAQQTVVATALDAGGSPISGGAVTWQSVNANIASVDTAGVVTAGANDTTYVRARSGTVVDSLRVVVDQRARHVVIFPSSFPPITALGDSLIFGAYGVDSLGNRVVNGEPRFATTDTLGVVRVSPVGVVTGLSTGTAQILALLDGATGTVEVTVRNDAKSLAVTPDSATIPNLGDSVRFVANAQNSRGDPISGAAIAWSTPDSTLARVTNTGWVVARGVGTVRMIASVDPLADTSRVRVLNVPVTLSILPDSAVLASLDDSLLLPVDIRNKRGDVLPPTSVTWTSDASLVARVTTTGTVIALDTGTAVVRATSPFDPSLRDSVLIHSPNRPASVVLDVARDTMTALGQQIPYAATVRNARGNAISGFPVGWSSTNSVVAGVSSTGVVTSLAFGTASIVAAADTLVATLDLVVRNPTLLYVDNGVVTPVRVGTRRRPYARIQDGVVAADANDTVLVRKGAEDYSETVALTRRVTLLGDDSAFAANNLDPLSLPLVSHDSGAAGILAHTIAPVVIKNLAIQHTVDGPAIEAVHSDVQVVNVFVNPPGTVGGRVGRGIAIDSSLSGALVSRVDVRNVRGYGIRLRDGAGATIDSVKVQTVDSVAGSEPGAGIRLLRESNARVQRTFVRGTQGPQILADSSPGAAIVGNNLAGRQQLVVVQGGNGAVVDSNAFDTRPLGLNGEVFDGSVLFEWAALLLQASRQHLVRDNTFRDTTGVTGSPMHAMRFIDVVNPTDSTVFGAQTLNNRVVGGRDAVRLRRSKVLVQGTRIESALTGVHAVDHDRLTLVADTVLNPLQGACVQGDSTLTISVSASRFENCTSAVPYAIQVTGAGAGGILSVTGSVFRANRAAVNLVGTSFTSSFTGRGDSVSGAGFGGGMDTAVAALNIAAGTATIAGNVIADHRFNAAVRVTAFSARVDSNLIARNVRGIRLGLLGSFTGRHNDIVDNDVAGVWNETNTFWGVQADWWGDARGPRRDLDSTAVGDSAAGKLRFDTLEVVPHQPGTLAAALRMIRGDGQTALRGTTLPKAFTVRVVDAAGRPVAGVSVTFTVTGGGGAFGLGGPTQVTVTSNASGLAEATLTLGVSAGTNTVTATAPGLNVVTFTATGT